MSWPIGFSRTKTQREVTTTNPDGTTKKMRMQGGPFFFTPHLIRVFGYRLEIYGGFRPTPPWSEGYGNEGDFGLGWWGRFKKKNGFGNLGWASRFKEVN